MKWASTGGIFPSAHERNEFLDALFLYALPATDPLKKLKPISGVSYHYVSGYALPWLPERRHPLDRPASRQQKGREPT
jgi:hypothetical protein